MIKKWLITGWICIAAFFAVAEDFPKVDSIKYLIETTKDDSVKVLLLEKLSVTFVNINVELSLQYGQKALELAEKTKNPELIARALHSLGITYFTQGLTDISAKYFYRYLEIQKVSGSKKMVAYALGNLGAILLQLEDYEGARVKFEETLKIFNELSKEDTSQNYQPAIISMYNNLGIVARSLKDTVLAIDYYSRGITLARKLPSEYVSLGNLLNNLGKIYIDQGKAGEALKYVTEAMEIRKQNKDQNGLVQSYRMMALYSMLRKDDRKTLEYLNKGYFLANEIGTLSHVSSLSKMLFEYYHERHNADSALKYKIIYSETEEKINLEATRKEITKFEITSQYKEKERTMMFEQRRKETRYLITGLVLFFLLIIIGLLYFLSQSRVRRLRLEKENADLSSKNLELEKIDLQRELELKNKELTTNVMVQIRKNELIQSIVEKLLVYSRQFRKEEQESLMQIIKELEKAQETSVWNEFEIRFQQVHNTFFEKLNEINPELSPNERKLCAFLKLNMTTKEIASITGQSVRSIEVARTRLRKKLDLTNSETGLIEFLSQL